MTMTLNLMMFCSSWPAVTFSLPTVSLISATNEFIVPNQRASFSSFGAIDLVESNWYTVSFNSFSRLMKLVRSILVISFSRTAVNLVKFMSEILDWARSCRCLAVSGERRVMWVSCSIWILFFKFSM